jgi:NADH-quinone oxidoreductase subunit N
LFGFWPKFLVFNAAVAADLTWLAAVAIATSVIGAFYYIMIVKLMYFDEPAPAFSPVRIELKTVLVASALFNTFFVLYPAPLVSAAAAAARSLF